MSEHERRNQTRPRPTSPSSAWPVGFPAPRSSPSTGTTCVTASSRSRSFTDERARGRRRRSPPCCRPELREGGLVAARHGDVRRARSSASARATRRSWTRSIAISSSALGGAGGRRPRARDFAGSIGVFAGCGPARYMSYNLLTNPELMQSGRHVPAPPHRQRQGLPHHARVVPARPARGRASTSRRPARRRSWRSTWRCRACSTANATWRWPAA